MLVRTGVASPVYESDVSIIPVPTTTALVHAVVCQERADVPPEGIGVGDAVNESIVHDGGGVVIVIVTDRVTVVVPSVALMLYVVGLVRALVPIE